VNITYTAVSNIELRNANGFDVWTFRISCIWITCCFIFRFVVLEVHVWMILYGFQQRFQAKVVWQ
jgi:hypothetical protein